MLAAGWCASVYFFCFSFPSAAFGVVNKVVCVKSCTRLLVQKQKQVRRAVQFRVRSLLSTRSWRRSLLYLLRGHARDFRSEKWNVVHAIDVYTHKYAHIYGQLLFMYFESQRSVSFCVAGCTLLNHTLRYGRRHQAKKTHAIASHKSRAQYCSPCFSIRFLPAEEAPVYGDAHLNELRKFAFLFLAFSITQYNSRL